MLLILPRDYSTIGIIILLGGNKNGNDLRLS
nr:MAG TPA: hypothetical protein [Caudoviricetes sp.]